MQEQAESNEARPGGDRRVRGLLGADPLRVRLQGRWHLHHQSARGLQAHRLPNPLPRSCLR